MKNSTSSALAENFESKKTAANGKKPSKSGAWEFCDERALSSHKKILSPEGRSPPNSQYHESYLFHLIQFSSLIN